MLDTNIVSNAMLSPSGPVPSKISALPRDSVCISAIVLGEMLFGYAKLPSDQLRKRLQGILVRTIVLPVPPHAASIYGDIRAETERLRKPIGQNDLWIAAHALALDLTLVTDNVGEFSRIPGLRVENWLRDGA